MSKPLSAFLVKEPMAAVCLTKPIVEEPTGPAKQEQWKVFAPHIVAEQVKGFDWLIYRSHMDDIRADERVLLVDPEARDLHSRFARILLAYVQLAEADLEAAQQTWLDNVPEYIGTPSFLDQMRLIEFSSGTTLAHLVDANGSPTSELWNLVRRSIHNRQNSGQLLAVLDPVRPEISSGPAPKLDEAALAR
jgi:hypothetical protein